jgi:hypothetical protein
MNKNLRPKHVNQSTTPAKMPSIITRVLKSVNFDCRSFEPLQSSYTGPVYRPNALEAIATAQDAPAWRLLLAQYWPRDVFVK